MKTNQSEKWDGVIARATERAQESIAASVWRRAIEAGETQAAAYAARDKVTVAVAV